MVDVVPGGASKSETQVLKEKLSVPRICSRQLRKRWFRRLGLLNFCEHTRGSTEWNLLKENLYRSPGHSGWMIAFGITFLLAAGVTLTPVYPEWLRAGVMEAFGFVCHQLPTRSPHIYDVQLAVCHRCMGIYWALPAAAILYAFTRGIRALEGRRILTTVLLAGIPAAVDWGGDVLGIWSNTLASRIITGSIFGIVAGYILAEGISDIVRDRKTKKAQ